MIAPSFERKGEKLSNPSFNNLICSCNPWLIVRVVNQLSHLEICGICHIAVSDGSGSDSQTCFIHVASIMLTIWIIKLILSEFIIKGFFFKFE